MITTGRFAFLPAGDLLEVGLGDLARGARTAQALLVAMAWPRLAPLGLLTLEAVDRVRIPDEALELSAYRLLGERHGREAHARFLAHAAELESALNALEREQRRRDRGGDAD